MKQGSKLELMQGPMGKPCTFAYAHCERCGSSSVPLLPGEGLIQILGHLSNEDTFDVAARGSGQAKAINLVQHRQDVC